MDNISEAHTETASIPTPSLHQNVHTGLASISQEPICETDNKNEQNIQHSSGQETINVS